MRPKINFCMPEYLDLAPYNKELTKYIGRCATFFLLVSLGLLFLPVSSLFRFFPESAGPCSPSASSTSSSTALALARRRRRHHANTGGKATEEGQELQGDGP